MYNIEMSGNKGYAGYSRRMGFKAVIQCTEVVENRAVLFEKNNVKDLTAKLQMLLDEPQTVCKYREGIAQYVTAKYKWDDVVERTLELYRK